MPNQLTPRQSVNKAFLKIKPIRSDIEGFKQSLSVLLENIRDEESEEHQKNLLTDFFRKAHYGDDYFINTKGRTDLVIHNGKTAKDAVGVMIEVKRTTNSSEMLTEKNINTKALQELVLYFLRERISNKNVELKHIIATNIRDWFIFDANVFEKCFAQDKKLVKLFEEFLVEGKDTAFFYNEIAKQFIEKHKEQLTYTYFNIDEYGKIAKRKSDREDSKLIPLYKLLSVEHLLKKPFLNDGNTLNKNFYTELLHLIGLEETKVGTKKLIERKKADARNSGSLLELAIALITSRGKLYELDNPHHFGITADEQTSNVALELVITWINRILFLKLLEAQLIKYHKGDKSFAFLNIEKIKTFSELDALFFQVLAVRNGERDASVSKEFANVPYLNSSLFEQTSLESATVTVTHLSDNATLQILSNTVLKDELGRKKTGDLATLNYLFDFLNSYDFTSDGGEEIQEDNKALINASVLGLIFEKINGYRDGSYFTPSFVTMYMCKESIRKAVVDKFNELNNKNCIDLVDVYNSISDVDEMNAIINSIKICDPAVGSGHFLVSALNEVIYIKSYLKILRDKDGKSLRDYAIEVVNDELIVTDGDGELVEYQPKNKESQRIQETLFDEKRAIIENCLFGVDINSNSVKICRLRLWIELLKNAYYREDGELETLPNIDINIKVGDSLISRFSVDADVKDALKESKLSVKKYKSAVSEYKNASDKQEKRRLEKLISDIKSSFRTEILSNDKKFIRLNNIKDEIQTLNSQSLLFETEARSNATSNRVVKLDAERTSLEKQIEDIRANKLYENAFEWRFEMPEVLNDAGDYVGFDVVIANPPYIDSETMVNSGLLTEREYIAENYQFAKGNWDIYIPFFERAFNLLKKNGNLIFITPDKWLSKGFGATFRQKNLNYFKSITKVGRDVFENAKVDSIITHIANSEIPILEVHRFNNDAIETLNSVKKETIKPPYSFDYLLSNSTGFLNLLERCDSTVGQVVACENACATSDCYLLKEHIKEFDGDFIDNYYKVVNTGTLDKYFFKWGDKEMTYLKDKYAKPVVLKSEFLNAFKNSYGTKTQSPKLIIKGLTKLDVAIDLYGSVIPGKSTLIFPSTDLEKLKLIAGVLNSFLAIKYINEKHSSSSYNGGVNFTKDMLNQFPIPSTHSIYKQKIVDCVEKILLTTDGALIISLNIQIDILVAQLYQIDYSELEYYFPSSVPFSKEKYKEMADLA